MVFLPGYGTSLIVFNFENVFGKVFHLYNISWQHRFFCYYISTGSEALKLITESNSLVDPLLKLNAYLTVIGGPGCHMSVLSTFNLIKYLC